MCFDYWGEQSREAWRPGFRWVVTGCAGKATRGGSAVGLENLKSTVFVCCWEPGDDPEDGQSLAGSVAKKEEDEDGDALLPAPLWLTGKPVPEGTFCRASCGYPLS